MYKVSKAYIDAIQQNSVTVNWFGQIITTNGAAYNIDPSIIVEGSGSLTRQICANDNIQIGTAFASELAISLCLENVNRYELYNATITMYFQLSVGSRWETVPLGVFTIAEPPERSLNIATLHAYDNMLKFNKKFEAQIQGKAYTILNLACEQCGVLLGSTPKELESMPNGSIEMHSASDVKIETYRDLIGYVAGYLSGFAYIGADGKLYIRTYGINVDRTITENWRFDYKPRDYEVQYTSITAEYAREDTEDAIVLSEDGLNYDFGTNPFVQYENENLRLQILRNILTKLAQISYTPFEARVPCDPAIMPGDIINFTGNHAEDGKLAAVTKQVITIGGSMTLGCVGADPLLYDRKNDSDKALSKLTEKINSVTNSINHLLYDYNTGPVEVGQNEQTVGMITYYISQIADAEGHLLFNYTATEPTRLVIRFYDQTVEELYSPVEIDIHEGTGTVDIPHAYLNRLIGVHVAYVTAQVYSGKLYINTRNILYTINAGNYAEAVDDVPMDVRDISLRQLLESNGPDQVWIVGIEDGKMLVSRREYEETYTGNPEWVGVFNGGEALDAAIEFDGKWVLRAGESVYTLETEDQPWYFWITPELELLAQHGDNEASLITLDTNVTQVNACRGYSSNFYPEQDQGLVVAYIKGHKPYYVQYIYDVQLETKHWLLPELLIDTEVEDFRVHRLNDYRLGFVLSTTTKNIWVYTTRTYVAQAIPKEESQARLTERSMFLYADKDTDLSVTYDNSISEDQLELKIYVSKPIRIFNSWRDALSISGDSVSYGDVEEVVFDSSDDGTIITIRLNTPPKKLITTVTINPNNDGSVQAEIKDCGYVKAPTAVLTYDTTTYRHQTIPAEKGVIRNTSAAFNYSIIEQIRAESKEEAGVQLVRAGVQYNKVTELRNSTQHEEDTVRLVSNGMVYDQVEPSPI